MEMDRGLKQIVWTIGDDDERRETVCWKSSSNDAKPRNSHNKRKERQQGRNDPKI